MGRSFVYANRFAIEFYHVHNFDAVVGVVFAQELNKAIALVHLGYTVFWHVDVHNWTGLYEELPKKCFGDFVVQAAYVDCSVLISFSNGASSHCKAGVLSSK